MGAGNVEARLLRTEPAHAHPCESLRLRNGLIGFTLPALSPSVVTVAPGDLVILGTDGIHAGFEHSLNRAAAPLRLAHQILERDSKRTDDALVLVVRYLGLPPD